MVAPLIDRYLEARLKIDELEYDSIENTYLFQRNGRALTSSQWSQFVKQAFGRHTPNGQSPPPKGGARLPPYTLELTHTLDVLFAVKTSPDPFRIPPHSSSCKFHYSFAQ